MNEKTQIDIAIVGGGIVGLLSTYKLVKKFPNKIIALFEAMPFCGDHTSGRNSGVLHAGIYYPQNSLKHRMCLEGNLLWNEICKDLSISQNPCGKFIIAKNKDEEGSLEQIFSQAKQNSVPGIRYANSAEINKLNKYANASNAIFSPSTRVLDVSSAISNITNWLDRKDVPVLKNTDVKNLSFNRATSSYSFQANEDWIESSIIVNASGLRSVEFRQMLGLNNLENYYVKGNYLSCSEKITYPSLMYPVPESNLKGLGVHCILDISGRLLFGPDTEETDTINYRVNQNIVEKMWPAISSLFKNIDKSSLYPDFAGVRPKIKESSSKKIITDFWIKDGNEFNLPGYFEFCGIESPGLTSAPSIANWLVKQI